MPPPPPPPPPPGASQRLPRSGGTCSSSISSQTKDGGRSGLASLCCDCSSCYVSSAPTALMALPTRTRRWSSRPSVMHIAYRLTVARIHIDICACACACSCERACVFTCCEWCVSVCNGSGQIFCGALRKLAHTLQTHIHCMCTAHTHAHALHMRCRTFVLCCTSWRSSCGPRVSTGWKCGTRRRASTEKMFTAHALHIHCTYTTGAATRARG